MTKANGPNIGGGEAAWNTLSPWWRRAVAELIDLAIVYVISSLLLLIIGDNPGRVAYASEARYLALDVAALIYYPVLVWRTGGQTFGKMLLKICVVRKDRSRMGLAQATWREAMVKFTLLRLLLAVPKIGPLAGGLVILADVLWPLWDRENRALHDMLARTRVIRASGSRSHANRQEEIFERSGLAVDG
jgi:uncharacterized RDD family membrane protein YckC